jgi:hypothetical protein
MKSILKFAILSGTLVALIGASSLAQADPTPTPAQQAQIDKLKTTYPLDTCPVSGDKLSGSAMGDKPVDYLYTHTKADGTATTRLVRFCCKDCLVKFKRNPDKYLKTIDAAQAKRDSSKSS